MAANLATYELNATEVTARDAEYSDEVDFVGGMNKGGSNACGVGINTGNYNPKASDWPRIADTVARVSSHLGVGSPEIAADYVLQVIDGADINDTVAFVTTAAPVAPDAELDATTSAVNRTGVTVPTAAWVWGTIPVA